jgi:hypothetical protein
MRRLHEKVVEKIGAKLVAHGQTKRTATTSSLLRSSTLSRIAAADCILSDREGIKRFRKGPGGPRGPQKDFLTTQNKPDGLASSRVNGAT